MASRTGIHIYIPKYFMVVRNCIKIFVLHGLEAIHRHIPYIVKHSRSVRVLVL